MEPLAWLAVAGYTLQIYFDFSGYSDMAIGLARMFGFTFPENFAYPYISQSIREFWRRWHISLSSWFRDYVYIPLGGNRCSRARIHANLLTVFLLCGLWHGASWNFIVWGLFHGFFLAMERPDSSNWRSTGWRPMRHAYALLVVLTGWVLFRAETLSQAGAFLAAMAGFSHGGGLEYHPSLYLNAKLVAAFTVAVIGATPLLPALSRWCENCLQRLHNYWKLAAEVLLTGGRVMALALLLVLCAMQMAAGTYNPFIYFRF